MDRLTGYELVDERSNRSRDSLLGASTVVSIPAFDSGYTGSTPVRSALVSRMSRDFFFPPCITLGGYEMSRIDEMRD